MLAFGSKVTTYILFFCVYLFIHSLSSVPSSECENMILCFVRRDSFFFCKLIFNRLFPFYILLSNKSHIWEPDCFCFLRCLLASENLPEITTFFIFNNEHICLNDEIDKYKNIIWANTFKRISATLISFTLKIVSKLFIAR
mgnify:CR=1 FL=1